MKRKQLIQVRNPEYAGQPGVDAADSQTAAEIPNASPQIHQQTEHLRRKETHLRKIDYQFAGLLFADHHPQHIGNMVNVTITHAYANSLLGETVNSLKSLK